MIPFNLDRFDDTANARSARQRIREIAMSYLSEPGKEREAAALLLARLVLRCVARQLGSVRGLTWRSVGKIPRPVFLAPSQKICDLLSVAKGTSLPIFWCV